MTDSKYIDTFKIGKVSESKYDGYIYINGKQTLMLYCFYRFMKRFKYKTVKLSDWYGKYQFDRIGNGHATYNEYTVTWRNWLGIKRQRTVEICSQDFMLAAGMDPGSAEDRSKFRSKTKKFYLRTI